MSRILMILAVSALLFADVSRAQPPQPQPMPPTVPAPQTPGTPQPPRTQPPAEQIPAPTPTPEPPAPAQPDQPAAAVPPKADVDHSTALMLLDRMQTLVDDALRGEAPKKSSKSSKSSKSTNSPRGAVGTIGMSGFESSGKVFVDRATLAELRSEISQIKIMLQR